MNQKRSALPTITGIDWTKGTDIWKTPTRYFHTTRDYKTSIGIFAIDQKLSDLAILELNLQMSRAPNTMVVNFGLL